MLKNYFEKNTTTPLIKNTQPKNETIYSILNYSKSIQVKKVLNEKVLLILN
jgi:hypothetical protein